MNETEAAMTDLQEKFSRLPFKKKLFGYDPKDVERQLKCLLEESKEGFSKLESALEDLSGTVEKQKAEKERLERQVAELNEEKRSAERKYREAAEKLRSEHAYLEEMRTEYEKKSALLISSMVETQAQKEEVMAQAAGQARELLKEAKKQVAELMEQAKEEAARQVQKGEEQLHRIEEKQLQIDGEVQRRMSNAAAVFGMVYEDLCSVTEEIGALKQTLHTYGEAGLQGQMDKEEQSGFDTEPVLFGRETA